MTWAEDRKKRLDAGERVSKKPKEPMFRRKAKDPWLEVKKADQWARIRQNRPQIPK